MINTTTSIFQKKPDYYTSKEECVKSYSQKIQTNPRYKNFCQTYFTAGDEEQFEEFRYDYLSSDPSVRTSVCENHLNFNEKLEAVSSLYEKINPKIVIDTFRYMFYKFKKGIFVKIHNNNLSVFLPFSNTNFVNEWSDQIDVTSMDQKNINKNKNTWFANNGLIRYEYPINEGDTNVCNMKNMLDELCQKRSVPDIEFFINRRDYPLLSKHGFEPYFDIWNSKTQPLVSHKYEKYCPIFSMSSTDDYADILLPTHEDWSRIQSIENKWFPHSFRSCEMPIDDIKWDNKKPIAVFRGASTGNGVTIDTNIRLKLAYLSSLKEIDPNDQLPFLDAGIHKWNLRPKKIMKISKLQTINIKDINIELSQSLSYTEQCQYKYIIHVDGHVSAFRLGCELGMKSVILKVDSEWKLWYSYLLQPYIHYIPIKEDLSNLIEQIKWCKNNDIKCQQIALNAYNFFLNFLQKDTLLDFIQTKLFQVKQIIGNYTYSYPLPHQILLKQEKEDIQNEYLFEENDEYRYNNTQIDYTKYGRVYGIFKTIKKILNIENKTVSISNEELIISKSNIKIYKGELYNVPIIKKTSLDIKKQTENIHEYFVSSRCVNKLLKHVPNFVYTFGICATSYNLISEYIDGITLYDFLNIKENFDMKIYLNILLQICLILQHAQRDCFFIHYDLTPWNIILQQLDDEVEIDYIIGINQVVTIRTKIIPILIDYGKSHIIYNHRHHGKIKIGEYSTVQDILSFLVTSIYQIISVQTLNKTDIDIVLRLSNFFSKSTFTNSKRFHNLFKLKSFLFYAKKHSFLIYTDKGNLETKNPITLFLELDQILTDYKFEKRYTFKTIFNSFMNKIYYKTILNETIHKNMEICPNLLILNFKQRYPIQLDSIEYVHMFIKLITNINLILNTMEEQSRNAFQKDMLDFLHGHKHIILTFNKLIAQKTLDKIKITKYNLYTIDLKQYKKYQNKSIENNYTLYTKFINIKMNGLSTYFILKYIDDNDYNILRQSYLTNCLVNTFEQFY